MANIGYRHLDYRTPFGSPLSLSHENPPQRTFVSQKRAGEGFRHPEWRGRIGL